ncbi:MAG: sensor histidine kinase [Acidobacteria bacterium]|nr:sensor histidine kinase [Acidobacteriota bacterium]
MQKEERSRIRRELHDETGQSLLLIRLQLERLQKEVPKELRSNVAEIRRSTEHTIREIRRVLAGLRPTMVEELGLEGAIRQLTRRFRKACAVRVRLDLRGLPANLSKDASAIFYRVLQEAYQNIAKHSGAGRINVFLHSTDRSVMLSIRDNGAGFDATPALRKRRPDGITGMRERVEKLGGRLEIQSRLRRGTRVTVGLPLDPERVPVPEQRPAKRRRAQETPDPKRV